MKNIDCKLTFSWSEENICTITDAICGKSLIMNVAGHSCSGDLNSEYILLELNNLIEILNTGAEKKVWLMKNPTSYQSGIIIRDTGHFEWDMVENGHYATIANNEITMNSSFNKRKVISMLCSAVSLLNQTSRRLNPKVNIVRRIADCKLLVWVHDGHCVAVAEKNVNGMAMSNALIDGEFYPALLVDCSRTEGYCSIYEFNTGELVFSCPLDDSIITYYRPSEELI